ncbi:uncharacterized protein (TIGR00266 family) [Halospina denitrificans]|uniref:Uncharacterized protein (TIGR00266 family) n=1 Tax=Halospina denitrificans TaxID=332522 RepID=A0A4R7JZE2_9GAMM|nr:TIGR00266 family protein [Halospina denitrificans]TDT43912.1 uncharacterized protein (TIGR00266 family) [Halospina denitrificans]
METEIKGGKAFSYLNVNLAPGETIIAESGAMSSMAPDVELRAKTNGGFWRALLRKLFGGESFFISHYTNQSGGSRRITFVQSTPGQMQYLDLEQNDRFCLQPGALIASSEGVKLGLRWAGFISWLAREGLFKLVVSGKGRVWYGACGALVEKMIDGEYIVDTSHLVAYSPSLRLRMRRSGGEGGVTRVVGKGKLVVQTRSVRSISEWVNPNLPPGGAIGSAERSANSEQG